MKEKLSLDSLKKIMADCPIKTDHKLFDEVLMQFNEEVLSINRELREEKEKGSNKNIDDEDTEPNINFWQELHRFYFYNLIKKYSRGGIDASEAKDVLESCIVRKYISYKKAKIKISTIKDDEHLTKKFTSDLYYSTLDYIDKKRKSKTVPIEKQDEEGEWVEDIELSEDRENHTIESMDYWDNDLSEMLSKMITKPTELSNYLMWKFKRLENVKMDFNDDFIELPMKFNLNNNIIARYYSWRWKI